MSVEREILEADVLVIGAGPAGLACALPRLALKMQARQLVARPT
jgi:flavin-dependent dehydrogenase